MTLLPPGDEQPVDAVTHPKSATGQPRRQVPISKLGPPELLSPAIAPVANPLTGLPTGVIHVLRATHNDAVCGR